MISRLVDQKGFDLLAALADELPRLGATFVLLGTGERRYEDSWLGWRLDIRTGSAARIGFDEGLAHLIEGGADMFLMPSRFEPCGLNQMYSLRYGTVPLVRATGGLFDTVQNFDPRRARARGLPSTNTRRRRCSTRCDGRWVPTEDRAAWRRIQAAGMRQDFSWDASAREYVKVYERAARHGVWA